MILEPLRLKLIWATFLLEIRYTTTTTTIIAIIVYLGCIITRETITLI